jgi:NADPH-dependent 2,4-dienoyl-CoA reductase/sulfur reductase-like enzyme
VLARRILVVGGVAAGPSAASKAARVNPDAEVILFEKGRWISYGICELPYYVSGEAEGERLVVHTPETLLREKRVRVRTRHCVEEVIPHRRILRVRDSETGSVCEERYDRLILATGARPVRLGVQGQEAENVFQLRSLDDGHRMRQFLEDGRPRRAVIAGGGYVGMEMADALRSRGIGVTVIHRHDLPLPGFERGAREKARETLESHGVGFVGGAEADHFDARGQDRVTSLIASRDSYEADLFLLSLGVRPNVDLAESCGIRLGTHGGILADQRQETSRDNIFAAGDCCEVRNLVTNKWMYAPLATVASRAGWTAGENAAGGRARFRGALRAVALRLFDMEFMRAGLSSREATDGGFRIVTEKITTSSRGGAMPGAKQITVELIAEESTQRLLGTNVYGGEGAVLRGNTLAVAIQHQMRIDDLQEWDLAYAPPFAPLRDPILVAANAARRNFG